MTEHSVAVLERTRDELRMHGESAIRFIPFGHQLLAAAAALDEVLAECATMPFSTPSLRLAAHRAMGALEGVFMRRSELRHPEAYQVLLDLAYIQE